MIVHMAMTGMLAGVAAVICDVVITMGKNIFRKKRVLPIIVLFASFVAVRFMKVNITAVRFPAPLSKPQSPLPHDTLQE